MHKWVIGSLLLASVVASIFVVKYGLNPKPIMIIKASNFEEPEKFSRYIYRQLYPKLKLAPILAFGTDEVYNYDDKMIQSLAYLLAQDLQKSVSIYTDREFLGYKPEMSSVKFTKLSNPTPEKLAELIREEEGKFIVVLIFKNNEIIHKFKESLVNRLEFLVQKEVLAFSFWSMDGIDNTQELKVCVDSNHFDIWMKCLKENNARSIEISKKDIQKDKAIGILERVSEKDFFIFLKNRTID